VVGPSFLGHLKAYRAPRELEGRVRDWYIFEAPGTKAFSVIQRTKARSKIRQPIVVITHL
jgi:hypothetical protein